jgi:branched-chain amino acid aminotransferase
MSTLVMINGEMVPPEQATVSVFDRGFLYGDSVFETIRTYRGVPFALDEHVDRLQWSAERVFIELPVDPDTFAREVREACSAAGNTESYIRLMVTRGTAETLGLDPALAVAPSRFVIVGPLVAPPASAYEQGVAVVTFRTQRLADATSAAGAKVGNYLVAVLATRLAREADANEALIIDGAGHVLEGSNSNVFAVIAGTLVTPPQDVGILPGITRARILDVARELDMPVELRPIELAELDRVDELFVCSSIREILPVVRVDGRAVKGGTPGPVTQQLLRAFRERVRRSLGLPPRSGFLTQG